METKLIHLNLTRPGTTVAAYVTSKRTDPAPWAIRRMRGCTGRTSWTPWKTMLTRRR